MEEAHVEETAEEVQGLRGVDDRKVHISELPLLQSKAQHREEGAKQLSGEELMKTALQLWSRTQHAADSDDGICDAVSNWLDNLFAESKMWREVLPDGEIEARQPKPGASAEEWTEFRQWLRMRKVELLLTLKNSEQTMQALYFGTMMSGADGQLTAIGLTRWVQNGFPQVTMGHKLCAALLCTNTGEDALKEVNPPWSAFIIEVPNGLLSVHSTHDQQHHEIRRILVTKMHNKLKGDCWGYIAFTEGTVTLWRFGAYAHELLPPSFEHDAELRGFLTETLTDEDKRISSLIGRLIVNTCLALSDKASTKKVGPGHRRWAEQGNKRESPEPVVRTFQLGQAVSIDLREHVKAFTAGKRAGHAPSVQVLVRGHYKTQPHGPRGSLRKVIWRAPFWRGPEDAPILTRPHEMKKE